VFVRGLPASNPLQRATWRLTVAQALDQIGYAAPGKNRGRPGAPTSRAHIDHGPIWKIRTRSAGRASARWVCAWSGRSVVTGMTRSPVPRRWRLRTLVCSSHRRIVAVDQRRSPTAQDPRPSAGGDSCSQAQFTQRHSWGGCAFSVEPAPAQTMALDRMESEMQRGRGDAFSREGSRLPTAWSASPTIRLRFRRPAA